MKSVYLQQSRSNRHPSRHPAGWMKSVYLVGGPGRTVATETTKHKSKGGTMCHPSRHPAVWMKSVYLQQSRSNRHPAGWMKSVYLQQQEPQQQLQ
jgi:hypothetical protein